jgi:16S rRNA (guanine527-N7)-methyltransferase
MERRTAFLREAVDWADAPEGGEVEIGRAEDLARRPDLEGVAQLVTSRSFGPPAVTAECAVRFLEIGGLLVVSEPPEDDDHTRWPAQGLARLGLASLGRERHGAAFQVLVKVRPTPGEYPRPVGVPGKKPLF